MLAMFEKFIEFYSNLLGICPILPAHLNSKYETYKKPQKLVLICPQSRCRPRTKREKQIWNCVDKFYSKKYKILVIK